MTDPGQSTLPAARRWQLPAVFARVGFIWILLLLTLCGGSLSSPQFLSVDNLFNVLLASAVLGCLVLAQSVVLLIGKFDLSTEANMIFVAILGALLMAQPAGTAALVGGGFGLAWPLAIVAMIAMAAFIGLINGLLVVKVGMNGFMATLAISIMLGGAALVLAEGRTLFDIPSAFRWVGSAKIGPAPVAALFLLLLFAMAHVVLARTTFGRRLYAVGSNRDAARASGINVDWVEISAFVICGALSGVAAFLLVGRLGTAFGRHLEWRVVPVAGGGSDRWRQPVRRTRYGSRNARRPADNLSDQQRHESSLDPVQHDTNRVWSSNSTRCFC
ncbi:MAG: ATPase [Devosia sp.]|nr:ATPase [Devosia sp.]